MLAQIYLRMDRTDLAMKQVWISSGMFVVTHIRCSGLSRCRRRAVDGGSRSCEGVRRKRRRTAVGACDRSDMSRAQERCMIAANRVPQTLLGA